MTEKVISLTEEDITIVKSQIKLFSDVLLSQRSKSRSPVLSSSLTASNTKRELDIITLRCHAPWSYVYVTWLRVTMNDLDMIIV